MLCSARELGLGDDHAGILALDTGDASSGTDVREVLGLDDVVFDLAITPNRPDAMGVVGVARELAAHFGLPFTVPGSAEPAAGRGARRGASPRSSRPPTVARGSCVRSRTVTMGRVAGMDAAAAARSRGCGRSATSSTSRTTCCSNAAARCTRSTSGGSRGAGCVVRLAEAGEQMTTLDGVERSLHPRRAADLRRRARARRRSPGSWAAATPRSTARPPRSCSSRPTSRPCGIAASAKRLGLRSEASARFERGDRPERVRQSAPARAIELLEQIAGARGAPPATIDRYPDTDRAAAHLVRTARVNAILGTDLDRRRVQDLLRPLDIEIDADGDALRHFVAIAAHEPSRSRA